MYQIRSNQKEPQAPLVQVNTACSPLQVETSIAGLTVIVYHYRGRPFNWIIVPPVAKLAFEAKIRAEFLEEIGVGECSRFVHHLSLWVTPERLRIWNIKFFQVTQKAGQLLFLFSGAYFWGWSNGHDVLEMKTRTGAKWDCGDYRFCNFRNNLCHEASYGKPGLYLQPKGEKGKY
jgi:JmjC domain, hydroxylase